jgi:aryl-alcohol dehydrogenase-like predicted oxidoreductase
MKVGDLEVRRLGFGAMRVCGPSVWGPPKDRDHALRVLRRAYELGCNFFDTADSYGPHVSEELIGETLHPYPDDLVIATKGGQKSVDGRPVADGRPAHLREACERSLRALRVETIDLYQLHSLDPEVPLEESLGALVQLRDEGKVRHIGVSNLFREVLDIALAVAPIVSVQNQYSVAGRTSDPEVDLCERRGLAFMPWAPILMGDLGQVTALARIAAERGATPAQIALAWLLTRSETMLPIPGTSSIEHLEENVRAAKLRLSNDELALLATADEEWL